MDFTNSFHNPYMAPRKWDGFWNLLTLLVIAAGISAAVFFAVSSARPELVSPPAPSAGEPAAVVLADPTEAPILATLAETPAQAPADAGAATEPVEDLQPAPQPTAFPDEPVDLTFEMRGTPVVVDSRILRGDDSCAWSGVAGQAFDLQGEPVTGLSVRLGGMVDGQPVEITGMTGTVLTYGPGGYEMTVANQPVASAQSLWVQLLDPAGIPLSEKIPFDTFATCEQNLILLNFKQIR